MPDPETFTCHLLQLHCYLSDEPDGDEVFLKHKGKRIWPNKKYKNVPVGATELDVTIEGIAPQEPVEIEIWDYDFLTPNDRLGKCRMIIDAQGGPFRTDLNPENVGDQAKYTLEWEAL